MKEYNAKIIVNDDKFRIAYECDKVNNKECPGYLNCRECNHTTDSRYAKEIMNEDIFNRKTPNQIRKMFKFGEVEKEEKIKNIITTNYYSSNGKLIKTVTEVEYEN